MARYIFRNALDNYTAVSNEFIQDRRLTPQDIGVLLIILSNKANWRVYPEALAERCGISKPTAQKILEKLESLGYVRTYSRSVPGKRGQQHYRFCSDRPISDGVFGLMTCDLDEELGKNF